MILETSKKKKNILYGHIVGNISDETYQSAEQVTS